MRIAILANNLPAALPIYEQFEHSSLGEVFIVLCPVAGNSSAPEVIKHSARLLLKAGRAKSLRLLSSGKLVVLSKPLDHPQSLERLRRLAPEIGLHKSGNIYREVTIKCFRLGILNAHIGLLPGYRGRSVVEWSVLQGDPVGISVFFLDAGIDTGEQIVFTESVDVSHCGSLAQAKQFLFDLDATFYRRAVSLISSGETAYRRNDLSGRRYYAMSKLFTGTAEQIFTLSNRQSAIANRQ